MLFVSNYGKNQIFSQCICLPKPIFDYIIKSARFAIFIKFNKSCKLFFAIYNFNICVQISLNHEYDEKGFHSFEFSTTNEKDFNNFSKNLWLHGVRLSLNRASTTLFSSLFPKIVRCEILILEISNSADIKFQDFKILTKSSTIGFLLIQDTRMVDYNGLPVSFDKIIDSASTAHYIHLSPCHVASMTALSSMKNRKTKLLSLQFFGIDNKICPDAFFKFLMENGDKENPRGYIKSKLMPFLFFNNSRFTAVFHESLKEKFDRLP